ncbi:MAG: hypothetical protein HZC40_22110 [Chloroflexi bacterium]|nr:hypothetical protein [Chloroflexota bacterium]
MQKSFWFVFVIVVATLSLTACAAPAATPLTLSPMRDATEIAQNEFQAQVTLMSPVLAGNNSITVQLRDAKTGKPPHDATVRVAVVAQKHSQTKDDDHAKTTTSSHTAASDDHSNTKKDDHASAPKDSHANEAPKAVAHADENKSSHQTETKTTSHADEDAGHAGKPLTAGKSEGAYVGQVMIPNAGDWLLVVKSEIEGKAEMEMFAVNATRTQETWLVLGGFLGINLAVIATAGITKRQAVKK